MFNHSKHYADNQLEEFNNTLVKEISKYIGVNPVHTDPEENNYFTIWISDKYSGELFLVIHNEDIITHATLYLR